MADSRPAAYAEAAAPAVVGPHVQLLALLSLGHFVIDLMQGALPALLPFLKQAHGLTYAAAGTIVLVGTVMSSIVQPLFGYLADQTARRWMLPASVALAGAGFALLGIASGYAMILGLVLVMSLGAAAYHPEGYKTATGVAGERKATGLSWFSLGGNIGVALGPPVITALVVAFGLPGSLGMMAPALVIGALFVAALPLLAAAGPRVHAAKTASAGAVNRHGAMSLLVLVVMLRSWTSLGFTTFIPFYYVDVLKEDPQTVGTLLFVFLGAGALGTVGAGMLADRWGMRPMIFWGLLGVLPLAVLFLHVTGPLAYVVIALMGAVLISTFTISVVLGQQYMPRNTGMASGLIVGFATGTAGIGVAALGFIADRYGLMSALWISALMPIPGVIAAAFLPAPHQTRS